MFHLFNKIYLDHEGHFNSKYPYTILYSESKPHPMSLLMKQEFDSIPSFESVVNQEYHGKVDLFWEKMVNDPKPHVIYADTLQFHKFQIQYWKSILKNNDVESLYEIYLFYAADFKMKSTLSFNRGDNKLGTTSDLYLIKDLNEFKELYETVEESQYLAELEKGSVGFEYLLGDYFHDQNSEYASDFLIRLEKLSWKCWFSDVNALKEDIVGSFYDIQRLLPHVSLRGLGPDEIFKKIKTESSLKWITDRNFNEQNISYVKQKYDKHIFCSLAKEINRIWGYSFNRLVNDKAPLAFDQILLTELIFEGRFLEFLMHDVKKEFGCIFVNEKIRDKSNMFMASYIYDKIRMQDFAALKLFQLK